MNDRQRPPRLTRHLLEALVILAVGVLIGLSINYRVVMDAFSGKLVAPLPASREPAVGLYPAPIDLAGVQAERAGGALLVDARIPELYLEGHIAGAVRLSLAEIDETLADFESRIPKDRKLILYCNGYGCPDSFDLGVRLMAAGYSDVLIFEGGFPAWQDAGLPVTEGDAP
jgi:rhodanese-related sulfurtransferase